MTMRVARESLRWLAWAMGLAGAAAAGSAQPEAQAPAVELPPMIITETSGAPPWLYVAAGDTEYLSRCSPSTTRAFVEGQLEAHQMLRVFVPSEFWPANAVPTVSVLVPLEMKVASDDAVSREMIRLEEESIRAATAASRQAGRWEVTPRFQILPNLRLEDRDMTAVFTYVNERAFDREKLIAAWEFVQAQLLRRAPMLPLWLIEGVTGLYRQSDFRGEPVTMRPFMWLSREETSVLQRDPEARRVLLPPHELFAPDVLLGAERRHELRIAVWRAQTALFVRWALDPANAPARDALWQLVRRACDEPVTERMFAECFGFGYSELRDRLSDYLPVAVRESARIVPGRLPPLPKFEVKHATPLQIARLRGEWERLEVPYVRGKHPTYVASYAEQARRTLRRAVADGERDARLVAALALCELDAGDPTLARPWLEEAAARRVARPRVYYELARLRWAELVRAGAETQRFSTAELEPVLVPLRVAAAQQPRLPEAIGLMAEAWLHSRDSVVPADLAIIAESARLFRQVSGLGFRAAVLHAKLGQRAEARELASRTAAYALDPALKGSLDELQKALSAAPGEDGKVR